MFFQYPPQANVAPSTSSYIVVALDGTLSSERRLQGTPNQITLTDGGANGDLTLSLPQNIHTGASPQFTGLTLSGLTAGSVVYAGASGVLSQQNSNFYWDATNKRLGLGSATSTSPLAAIHIFNDGTALIAMDAFQNSTQGVGVLLRKGRGSQASPEATASSDDIGIYNARGMYNTGGAGTGVFASNNAGIFKFRAQEAFTSTAQGTYFIWGVTHVGEATNRETKLWGLDKALTDGSATDLANFTCASNSTTGAIVSYLIEATDGTDYQAETGQVIITVVNKAGAFTTTITEVNSQQALSGGTLTTTWAITGANPAVLSVNANTSLAASAGYPRITYDINGIGRQQIDRV